MKVVITTSSFAAYDEKPLQQLMDAGFEVILNPYGRKLSGAEVVTVAADADGLVAGTEPLTREVLAQLPLMKVISRCGVGMDNVDLDACKEFGIEVRNTPLGPTLAVAELTVGLTFDLLRKISLMDRELRDSGWKKRMGNLLNGKKIGLIGFGRIGQKTAELFRALGCSISYYDPAIDAEKISADFRRLELDALLQQSDIVTLHVSGKFEKPLLGEAQLDLMKPGAWLVNVARGNAVDEDALYQALTEKHLSGAALDVFGKEPYDGPLQELEQVVLTPHIGSYACEARVQMEADAVSNLMDGLRTHTGLEAAGQV